MDLKLLAVAVGFGIVLIAAKLQKMLHEIHTSIDLVAELPQPRSEVSSVVFDLEKWKTWNDVFAITTYGTPKVGQQIHVKSTWSDGTVVPSWERITEVKPDERLCWTSHDPKVPFFMLNADQCVVLSDAGSSGTTLRSYAHFGGAVATLYVWSYGEFVKDSLERFNEALARKMGR
eukprot:gnl/MRDRNA2_/MRDRNA2_136925_c0_seq1.p1 gnl/MRDRNA2_/MRDRNA2_136925_c0~~gnl/MRDRNA2_/MRDRNA2_136925_c0_seq1.p1  ORF type:complete len:175 (+),score=31.59 gnl/MRDRNA2_/MRDRNA2_136925_c0_seq1:101-625(+)